MLAGVRDLIKDFVNDVMQISWIVLVTTAFLFGILVGYNDPDITLFVFTAAGFVALVHCIFLRCRRKAISGKILAVLVFFVLGFLRSSSEVHRVNSDFELVEATDRAVEITCEVGDTPSVKPLKGRSARYRFKASGVRLVDSGRRITAPVKVNWYGDRDGATGDVPECGDRWRFEGRMYTVKNRHGEAFLNINSGEGRSSYLSSPNPGALSSRVAEFRKGASLRVAIGIEDWNDVVDIHQAVLLGYKSKISWQMRQIFSRSGTIHVFAISGLHIALLASVLVFFVSSCGISRYNWIFILAPLLLIYTLATGLRPSSVRACIMAIFYFAAPLIGRRFNALSALAATALAVHVFAPANIFDLGCILSFCVMLGLIVLFKPLSELLKKGFRIEEIEIQARLYHVSENYKRARHLRWAGSFLRFTAELLGVTTSAWLASMPLSAYFFERITPGGIFANMIVTPSALMLVTAGILGYAASFFSRWMAICFNNAAGFFTTIMIRTASFISNCRFMSFEVKAWPLWGVWIWFAVLLVTAWLMRRQMRRSQSDLSWLKER